MDNRINEIRRVIRALRVSMREAEAIMHEQINRDEDCTFVAHEVMHRRCFRAGSLERQRGRIQRKPRHVGRAARRLESHRLACAEWNPIELPNSVAHFAQSGIQRHGAQASKAGRKTACRGWLQ